MLRGSITANHPVFTWNAEAMKKAAEMMARSIDLNFEMGGRPPWEPLGGQYRYADARNPLTASGRLRKSMYTDYSGTMAMVSVGKDLPYARIMREGGTFTIPITKNMKSFFWAKWYSTGDDKWKYMALSNRSVFVIHIPPREYMSLPQEEWAEILDMLATDLVQISFVN